MVDANEFVEFEHKFLVSVDEKNSIISNLQSMAPSKAYHVDVEDHYFLVAKVPGFIYRFRRDHQYNQLTVKSLVRDSEQRTEVNLDLDRRLGLSAARAFLSVLEIEFEAKIAKSVEVFYFPEVEIVYYEASSEDAKIACVEFEVRQEFKSTPRDVLESYQKKLGFNQRTRCQESLFHLLIFSKLPSALQNHMYSLA